VSVDGSVAVVGAPGVDGGRGAAYVFVRDGDQWMQQQMLTAFDAAVGDRFGAALAIDGTVALVGAPMESQAGLSAGAVYVFRRTGDAWTFEQKLLDASPTPLARFGSSIALLGDMTLIGAPLDGSIGSVVQFAFNGGSWVQQQTLNAADPQAGGGFGSAVSITTAPGGLVAAIGAPQADDVFLDAGAAYVFRLQGGSWQQETRLATDDLLLPFTEFGHSVAISGDTVAVGAWRDSEVEFELGSIFVFARDATSGSWEQSVRLTAPDADEGDRLGASVVLRSGSLLAGAEQDDELGPDAGAAYRYESIGNVWLFAEKVLASDGAAGDRFGAAVASRGGSQLLGAAERGQGRGAAYLVPLAGFASDCNDNGLADDCEVALGDAADCNRNGVPDSCDIADGVSLDDDGNGFPDECDTDCNRNGISDLEELASGNVDCNDNGVLDACDIAAGVSDDANQDGFPDECGTDCNGNGIADDVDLAVGESEDCNGNGVPDECDLERYRFRSAPRSPIGNDVTQSVVLPQPTLAAGDVLLTFTAHGDLNLEIEALWVLLDDQAIDQVFRFVGTSCALDHGLPPNADALVIDAGTWNDALTDGALTVTVEPTPSVGLSCDVPSFVTVAVDHPGGDCNGNGVVDACDIQTGQAADVDGNGIPDECLEPACPDVDGSGSVDVDDLIALILAWGTGDVDLTGDGILDVDDLVRVILAWGAC
jgi:hypothetical protein